MAEETMRIDRFLWFTRIVRTRAEAQALAETSRLRIDGRAIGRAHCLVRIGNVLTFARDDRVFVLRVEALPARRGPAAEARGCYEEISEGGSR